LEVIFETKPPGLGLIH
jgi:hypothetical protein